jgi:hypothetical protein
LLGLLGERIRPFEGTPMDTIVRLIIEIIAAALGVPVDEWSARH